MSQIYSFNERNYVEADDLFHCKLIGIICQKDFYIFNIPFSIDFLFRYLYGLLIKKETAVFRFFRKTAYKIILVPLLI
jgi:hypothetical protein